MAIESAPYYFAKCDNCGELCDYGEYSAWADHGQAVDSTLGNDWTTNGTRWHCTGCPELSEDEAPAQAASGPGRGQRDG